MEQFERKTKYKSMNRIEKFYEFNKIWCRDLKNRSTNNIETQTYKNKRATRSKNKLLRTSNGNCKPRRRSRWDRKLRIVDWDLNESERWNAASRDQQQQQQQRREIDSPLWYHVNFWYKYVQMKSNREVNCLYRKEEDDIYIMFQRELQRGIRRKWITSLLLHCD